MNSTCDERSTEIRAAVARCLVIPARLARQTGHTIGVVDSISGVYKWIVRLKGKVDHAGTAPMNMRGDAFIRLADFET